MADCCNLTILAFMQKQNSPKSNQTKGLLKIFSEEKRANEESTPELNPQKNPFRKSLLLNETQKKTEGIPKKKGRNSKKTRKRKRKIGDCIKQKIKK